MADGNNTRVKDMQQRSLGGIKPGTLRFHAMHLRPLRHRDPPQINHWSQTHPLLPLIPMCLAAFRSCLATPVYRNWCLSLFPDGFVPGMIVEHQRKTAAQEEAFWFWWVVTQTWFISETFWTFKLHCSCRKYLNCLREELSSQIRLLIVWSLQHSETSQ